MDRDAAIANFNREVMVDSIARQHLEEILKMQPLSIMFVVEMPNGDVQMTSVPFSFALIRGLAETAFRLTIGEGQDDVGDDDSGDE